MFIPSLQCLYYHLRLLGEPPIFLNHYYLRSWEEAYEKRVLYEGDTEAHLRSVDTELSTCTTRGDLDPWFSRIHGLRALNWTERVRQYHASRFLVSVTVVDARHEQYIKDWVDFHTIVGIDHFYIYANYTPEVLVPYVANGVVTLQPLPLYDSFTNYTKHEHEWRLRGLELVRASTASWVAGHDLDEYFFAKYPKRIPDILRGTAAAQWNIHDYRFGTGNVKRQPFNVTAYRTHGSQWGMLGKSIARVDAIHANYSGWPHQFELKPGMYTATWKFWGILEEDDFQMIHPYTHWLFNALTFGGFYSPFFPEIGLIVLVGVTLYLTAVIWRSTCLKPIQHPYIAINVAREYVDYVENTW